MSQQDRQFETFSIDTDRGVVLRAGEEVRLRRQSFDVLMYLVDRPGTLVTKDELVAAIWGNTAVTDNSLTQCMAEIRKALGDDDHRIVRTVVRRGYLFEAPALSTSSKEPRRLVLAWTGAGIAASVALIAVVVTFVGRGDTEPPIQKPLEMPTAVSAPGDPSIALVQFENLGGGDEEQLFIDSIREEIARQLAGIDRLHVVSSLSIDRASRDDMTMRELGETLDVDYVLRGSARRAEDTLRLRVQLFDSTSDELTWEESHDVGLSEISLFAAEDPIAVALAIRIGMKTLPDFYLAKSEQAPANIAALNHFYNGVYHLRKCQHEGLGPGAKNVHLAIGRFEESIAADDNWAPPHFGIGRAMALWSTETKPGDPEYAERLGVTSARMRRAVDIDSRYAPALSDLARIQLILDRDFAAARQTYERIVSLGVKEAHWLHAIILQHEQRFDAAAAEMRNTIETFETEGLPTLQPRIVLVRIQMCAGRYQDVLDSIEEFRSVAAQAEQTGIVVNRELLDLLEARAYLKLGERGRGLALTESLADRYGSDLTVASLLALAGKEDRARRAMLAAGDPTPKELDELFAVALELGEYDIALDYLEASVPVFDPMRRMVYCDGRTNALAGNARFNRILRELGIPE